jgi:hypothetical protein
MLLSSPDVKVRFAAFSDGIRNLLRGAVLAAATFSVVGATGCAAVAGDQEIETKFRVKPRGDGTFFGWTEISIDDDPNSVDGATLGFVTLRAQDPPNADCSFLASLTGEAVTPEKRTQLVSQTEFPEREPEVALKVDYKDDLRGFFTTDEKHTIRIEWNGSTNPSFTNWPENGFEMKVVVSIKIDD